MYRFFLILFASIPALAAHAVTIEGLEPFQVVQVDDSNGADVTISGTSEGVKVEATAALAGKSSYTSAWTPLGDVAEGRYSGTLRLEAGGPYSVTVRALDASGQAVAQAQVANVLAGDLWVLAGQSNMQGVGNLLNTEPPHPQVNLLRMNHQWTHALEPIHILQESPDPVHGKFANDDERAASVQSAYKAAKGAGLGMAFGRAMVEATGRPVGLIATAHGGTSLEQWSPEGRDKGGETLYGSMLAQIQKAGGKVRGVLWYQGESDASAEKAPSYGDRFKDLIAAMRNDFGGPGMPFYYVQIGAFAFPGVDVPGWNRLRAEQLRVEQEIAPGGMVASIDLALDDLIHIGTPGLITLGERLAHLAQRDLFQGTVQAGPRVESTEIFESRYGAGIRVRFASVNGALSSAGRVTGFVVTSGPDGVPVEGIYKQEVDPEDPASILLWVQVLPEAAQLWYGYGANPYCNITDAAGMALPAFGPLALSDEIVERFKKK
jgi:sialate O-acetylesterase